MVFFSKCMRYRKPLLMLTLLALCALLADDLPQSAKTAETIVVTATNTPTRLGETPASVVVISRQALATTAAATTDDALRQVPGFTLFRRSGSRSANPTSQGVSLRGIGASGASRALVLDDGIPLNDPFGGWVYWGRVPRQAIAQIEVVRGGASDLYGSGAMGGVVQFMRRGSAADDVSIDASGGSERTGTSSLFAAMKRGDWSGSIAAGWLSTNGYVLVQRSQRGAVDVEADTRNTTIDFTLRRNESFVRLSHYAESRSNGTPLQINDTAIRQIAAGTDARIGSGSIVVRAYGSNQDYHQTFSAIAADRNSERLTVDQRVPSSGRGGSLQWFSTLGRNVIVAGADLRQIRGASEELQYAVNGKVTPAHVAGRQNDGAAYIEDVATLSTRVTLAGGIRFDSWRNFDAERSGAALANRSDDAWSPRLTLLVRASDRVTLTAAAYRAFRAPTLNELYRAFRVGNVQTLANENLGAEHLSAIELGARIGPLRFTAFSMTTDDTIANVTLSSTSSLITRQRRNLGSGRSRGAELEAEEWLSRRWRVSAGYLFCDAVVTSGDLAGRRLPQVPRNSATVQVAFNAARGSAGMQARWSSMQFDDDLNQLPLRSYAVADLFAAYPITTHFEATFAVENATNRRVEVSATPVITLGTPRTVRVGARYSFR